MTLFATMVASTAAQHDDGPSFVDYLKARPAGSGCNARDLIWIVISRQMYVQPSRVVTTEISWFAKLHLWVAEKRKIHIEKHYFVP